MEPPRGVRITVLSEIIELPRFEIKDGGLIVFFDRRKIQRVAETEIERQARAQTKVVLREEFEKSRPRPEFVRLQIDREVLHLPEQKARQRAAGHAREARRRAA